MHAYDPTVSFPPERGNSISFQKLGVAAKRLRMVNDTMNIYRRGMRFGRMELVISY